MASTFPTHIKIGVFIPNETQVLDVATVDILGVMSKEYLGLLPYLPAQVSGLAPSVTVYYITTAANGDTIPCTSGMAIRATHVYTDEEVGPGKLDVIVVPGPAPTSQFEEGGLKWLREQAGSKGVDVLSVCTGAFVCCAAGIADGRLFSGPRGLQKELAGRFPKVKLVGDERRWVRDGNLWSSGGVTNGNDLMAAYARDSGRWPQSVVELGLMMTEVTDRGPYYESGKHVYMLGAAWTVVKAWMASLWAPKRKAA